MNDYDDLDFPYPETPDRAVADSEFHILDSFINPESKTSYDLIRVKDKQTGRYEERAKFSNFSELNTRDLSNSNLDMEELPYVYDTLLLIDQIEYLELISGYDFYELLRFFRNNVQLYLSLSKSKKGTLLRAATTKEIKQIMETRRLDPKDRDVTGENKSSGFFDKFKRR